MSTRGSQSSSQQGPSWCTIESDPGVFTELITQIGVKDVQMEEIYELDKSYLEELQPIYGLIFLFKWTGDKDDRASADHHNLFFANQVINNACATQAILSILLNADDVIEVGDELRNFKSFTSEFPPDLKGLSIGNCELIRKTHNSFARPEPFMVEESSKSTDEEEDAFHFISYIQKDGAVWELDGLKSGPIHLGELKSGQDWLDIAFPVIMKRIEKYSRNEIRFNLMAIIKNRRTLFREQIEKLERSKNQIQDRMKELSQNPKATGSPDLPNTPEEAKSSLDLIEAEIRQYQQKIMSEEDKFKHWKIENIRRKHNYIPFLVNLLRILGEKGHLPELIEKANKKHKSS